MKNVLVYVQLIGDKISPVTKEIISYVKENFTNITINGVLLGDSVTIKNAEESINHLSVDSLYIIKNEELLNSEINLYAVCLEKLITELNPDILLMGATSHGRELAPRLASKLNIGLTADCTELSLDSEGHLLATRPTYGGKMLATIYSKTLPNFATIRQGAFKLKNQDEQTQPDIISFEVDLTDYVNRIQLIKSELIKKIDDWTNSDVIVAGGLGLQTKENFNLIYKFAKKINAKPAATRAVVERAWASHDIQVGQTGASVTPKLYIAFGISGAMQHIVGITNSDKIIAVNTDENAPIMNLANIPINTDAIALLKELTD